MHDQNNDFIEIEQKSVISDDTSSITNLFCVYMGLFYSHITAPQQREF